MVFKLTYLKCKPLLQASWALGLACILQVSWFLLDILRNTEKDVEDIWMLCPVFLMLYILFNILFGFTQKEVKSYYGHSIYSFFIFLIPDIGCCTLLTRKSIFEMPSIAQLIFVFGIVYLVFLSILNLIRFILQLVLKQDQKIKEDMKNNL